MKARGVEADTSSLSRVLQGGLLKKEALRASERARVGVAGHRRFWVHVRQPLMRLEPARLVFIDETAVATNLTRRRGRSLRGEPPPAEAPFGHWETQTFVAGLWCDSLTALWVINGGPINRIALNLYIETQLAPALRRGDIAILANLSFNNSAPLPKRSGRAAHGSCSFPVLTRPQSDRGQSPSTPCGRARVRCTLHALGDICDVFDTQECWNYFISAAYASD